MEYKRRFGRKYHHHISVNRNKQKPDFWTERFDKSDKILIIACGALAKEITALIRINNWTHLQLRYLPAKLHNEPQKITQNIRKILMKVKKT